jgi:type I restriction enzyme M protein
LSEKSDIKKQVEEDSGVQAKEKTLNDAVESWWAENESAMRELPKTEALMELRTQLLSTFEGALRPVGLLDRFRVSGVIATWWGDVQNDLKTIAARGFLGLVEAWETSILTAMEDKKSNNNPLDHRLVKRLLPEYLDSISELEAKKAELDATIKGATAADDEDGDGEAEEQLSEDEVKALKKELSAAKKKLKAKEGNFTKRLQEGRAALDEDGARELVLGILRTDLDAILARYVADHRQRLVAAVENWWDKYRVTLTSIEEERDAAAGKLREYLGGLGYA